MRSSFLPKSQPKITEISALEVYYLEGRAKISVIFGWNFITFGRNDDLINLFWIKLTFSIVSGKSHCIFLLFFQVIIAVTTTKSMQSVTNIFIVNLATADMLVMLFCAPPSVIWDVTNTWIFGSLMCRVIGYIQVKLII